MRAAKTLNAKAVSAVQCLGCIMQAHSQHRAHVALPCRTLDLEVVLCSPAGVGAHDALLDGEVALIVLLLALRPSVTEQSVQQSMSI